MKRAVSFIALTVMLLYTFAFSSYAGEPSEEWCHENCHWELTDTVLLEPPSAEGMTYEEGSLTFYGEDGKRFEGHAKGVRNEYGSEELFRIDFYSYFYGRGDIFLPNAFIGTGAGRDDVPGTYYGEEYASIYRRNEKLSLDEQNVKTRTRSGEEATTVGPADINTEYIDKKVDGKFVRYVKSTEKNVYECRFPKIRKIGGKACLVICIASGVEAPDPLADKLKGQTGSVYRPYLKTIYEYEAVKNSGAVPDEVEEDSGIRFFDLWGEVSVRPDDEVDEAYEYAEYDTVLHWRDRIRTKSGSGAVLEFPDRSRFTLRENTVIVLPPKRERESKLAVLAGKTWINLKKMVRGENMQIEVSQAVLGIKGTSLAVEVDSETGEAVFYLFTHGAVVMNKETGERAVLSAGKCARIKGKENEVKPFDIEKKINEYDPDGKKGVREAYEAEKDDGWVMPDDIKDMELMAEDEYYDFSSDSKGRKGISPVPFIVAGVLIVTGALIAGIAAAAAVTAAKKKGKGKHPGAVCPVCGKISEKGAGFCKYCGSEIGNGSESDTFCPKCGKKIDPGTNFCRYCGKKL